MGQHFAAYGAGSLRRVGGTAHPDRDIAERSGERGSSHLSHIAGWASLSSARARYSGDCSCRLDESAWSGRCCRSEASATVVFQERGRRLRCGFERERLGAVPETRWAKTTDGAHIGYQVTGSSATDAVFMTVWGGFNVELDWDWPPLSRFLGRLASFTRLIRFDLRGFGTSDPPTARLEPTLEEHVNDLLAVLDAVGSRRAALVVNNLSGLIGMFFAAAHPERVSALVLDGCYARLTRAEDMPWGVPEDVMAATLSRVEPTFGQGFAMDFLAPSLVDDETFVAEWGRRVRLTAGPAISTAMARAAALTEREAPVERDPGPHPGPVSQRRSVRGARSARATSPSTSATRNSSSYPATTTSASSETPMRSSARSKSSSRKPRPTRAGSVLSDRAVHRHRSFHRRALRNR